MRRKYTGDDMMRAAQIIAAIQDEDEAASVWSRLQIDAAAAMLRDIAAGMADRQITCRGQSPAHTVTDIEDI